MASWDTLKSYIHSNYRVRTDKGTMLALGFDLDGGRQQTIVVSLSGEIAGTQWVEVSTAVAKESQINPRDLLVRSDRMVCGALSIRELPEDENLVVFRHSIPLADLDPSEFEGPLHIAVIFGDQLEQELTGVDTF